ncbi:unnamed protein product [Rotaria socialis]|uniref:Uncharacterized protein n=1 Tax=Rotaria socialis TaxID=392032 RepID=A0A817QYU2_9BILA|nr:unnamed protein product [Rotaria socialis]CAF3337742.1 unnamed protein product [Rotaria socialis]CAF3456963.1 unnamed protein product [Rotaria socialis]CAF3469869.1 unnamed protein product [Rotaria socialis]CAF3703651.1 unnamed protein product [Rotaria socialis]
MAQQEIERRPSKKSSNDQKSFVTKKKTKAELEQEAYMARQYAIVIGELKAAEARNRIRATRLRFSKSYRDEIDQIIAFQPNALSALRFEAFMTNTASSQKEKVSSSLHSSPRTNSALANGPTKDSLTQIERRRVQNLLLDDQNLLVDRTD